MTRILWVFVGVVTYVDCLYVIRHEATLPVWEANPVACLCYATAGMKTLLFLRIATVFLGYVMSQVTSGVRPFFTNALTTIAVLSHLYLAVVYAIIYHI